jgi:hypothetical protein
VVPIPIIGIYRRRQARTANHAPRAARHGRVVLDSGLSPTAYDLLRVGAWALVIVGGLLVVTGVIRYWASQTRR